MMFDFKGFDAQGNEFESQFEAATQEEAAGKLRSERGLFLLEIKPSASQPGPKVVSGEGQNPQPVEPAATPEPPKAKKKADVDEAFIPPDPEAVEAPRPQLERPEVDVTARKPEPKKHRSFEEDMDRAQEVLKLLEGAKVPKKTIEKAKEEMVLCLIRKAILK